MPPKRAKSPTARGRSPSPKKRSPTDPVFPGDKGYGAVTKRKASPKPAKSAPSPYDPVFPGDKGYPGTSPPPSPGKAKAAAKTAAANFSEAMGAGSLMPMFLVCVCPPTANVLAFITHSTKLKEPTLTAFYAWCKKVGPETAAKTVLLGEGFGSKEAWTFFGAFCLLALVLNFIPAKTETGPPTATNHVPKYVDNGMRHCILFSAVFLGCSQLGLGYFDMTLLYTLFPALIQVLNIFGLTFCAFLTLKGLKFPSTQDAGSSGSLWIDYYWGTELYPRIAGVDVKRFVNCRFSMTFWQLAPVVYAYMSYTKHGTPDYGLCFAALSQYIYLVKFFYWEIGYMRSIDIIVDRAGFYETWGCLCFVPSVYSLHSRLCVKSPSGLSLPVAAGIFAVGILGVLLNFWADMQRQRFRESSGTMKVFGKEPVFVEARYTVVENGREKQKQSLLLASGFWGGARHLHYLFELMAAWSWCLLANPVKNGVLVLFYCVFLTVLLIHRSIRDDVKCSKKYGGDWESYKMLVPYKILPGIF